MIERENLRRYDDPWRADITQSIGLLKAQHAEIRIAVAQNTVITKDIKDNTEEIIQFFKAGKGFFTMMGYFGKVMKWAGIVAGALVSIWAATHWGEK